MSLNLEFGYKIMNLLKIKIAKCTSELFKSVLLNIFALYKSVTNQILIIDSCLISLVLRSYNKYANNKSIRTVNN